MQALLEEFLPGPSPLDAKSPCPYCGELCAAVFASVSSGNWVKPYHVGPVKNCPAFAHWVFPWCAGSCIGCEICDSTLRRRTPE